MEDAENENGAPTGQTRSKAKYMNLLQDVADRKTTHISIELDDLDTVRDGQELTRRAANSLAV